VKHERQVIPPPPPEPVLLHHITLTEDEAFRMTAQLQHLQMPHSSALHELLELLGSRNTTEDD
jgi:hypothetical protein